MTQQRHSYSGLHASSAQVHDADSPDDISQIFDDARQGGRRVTLAGAGLSFDAQALGGDIILSTRRLDHIAVHVDAQGHGVIRVGPGARWHDIAKAAADRDFVAPVMVSSGAITAGGTVATNGLSRFSPVFGKEGRWVRAVRVLMPDGTDLRASRDEHAEVFYAIVGGLGLVGVIIEIEYDLIAATGPLRVESWVERRPTLEGLGAALRVEPSRELSAKTTYALLVPYGDDLRVLFSRSRYVSGAALQPMLPHRPQNILRVPIELAIQNINGAGQRFWRFAYDRYVREDRPYVDDLKPYTFFMDGNVRTRRFAMRLGLPFHAVQQTFIIPSADGDDVLLSFVNECHQRVLEAGLGVAMFDVLHLPEDEPFALSSSSGKAGFAVTLTFDGTLRDGELSRLADVLSALSVSAQRSGGCVHLTKNVMAEPRMVTAMYREGLDRLLTLRQRYDPDEVLTSDFAARLFPSLIS